MPTISLFPSEAVGKIKPLNGVGGGPVTSHFTYDATGDFREAGIPFCRTHDIEYPFGAGEFVDIHCVFRDFGKDENDPASYNFTFTDEYLKAVRNAGAEPFYRLGTTIEHQPIKLYIHPPADYEKWGRVCSHIISHYNDGWADGFFMGIRYWEIWNEPDIAPCWTGTPEQFCDLYAAAAPIIKRDHPDVKVGGCAWAMGYGPFAEQWLQRVRDEKLPMDFYSWHLYMHTPRELQLAAEKVTALLDKYGFAGTEQIFDEWNYAIWGDRLQRCYDVHKTYMECAFMAAVMSTAQDTAISKAMYYDVQMLMNGSWNGVFAPVSEGVHASLRTPARLPGYYALYAWNVLRQLGTQIGVRVEGGDLYVTAARDEDGELAALVSYFNDDAGYCLQPPPETAIRIDCPGTPVWTAFVTDGAGTFAPAEVTDGILRLKGNSCALLRMKKV
ncbi:MAG: hypothetical protein IJJ85_11870 [Clostridia bacterium]|nr:hypothetical protein [Clostridia bacterium]